MPDTIRRILVEKRQDFNTESENLYHDLTKNLGIEGLVSIRVIDRYDLSGLTDREYARARSIFFADQPVNLVYDEDLSLAVDERLFVVELLPGQFDQRAECTSQGLQVLTGRKRPAVACAKVIILKGPISDKEFARIKHYCINPVESKEADRQKPQRLGEKEDEPGDVAVLHGFTRQTIAGLVELLEENGLAMSLDDLLFCQAYFRDTENRDPTITEIKVIDTYWSDHCRHTTFLTEIKNITFDRGHFTNPAREAYREYLASREHVYGEKKRDICLMDIALIAMKEMRRRGLLTDLDESEEVNACSITVNATVDGNNEEWLVMFKNETHNHPTEIEPFGGAATCLGGAIRDPLSGRTYVYQAMRITGSADPRTPIKNTLEGKLPQRKITTVAAAGYSNYGNQIGLAAGQVAELYDEGFLAKRMEIGFVISAAPRKNVSRKKPVPGDAILLLGGRTGRDGCGGATGASKEHTEESLLLCGAEVQKGNPPTERNIQRLFRNPRAGILIKKCNDFGAGGVSVAIGELTDGVEINLDAVPPKYAGLDGTELAISESQERMAVVVDASAVDLFRQLAHAENLEATVVAGVTADRRLKMLWRGRPIVNIQRDFLDTNGVKQITTACITAPIAEKNFFSTFSAAVTKELPNIKKAWLAGLQDLNICSQKGLVELFDSTSGAATLLMPLGGVYQVTPAEGMAARLPVFGGETTTATLATYGYNPQLSRWSPFHGGLYAVVEAVAKMVAMGGDYRHIRLTLQEYFEKLGGDPSRWGKPLGSLLGAFLAQKKLGIPAIGGKDSMSGTFMDLHVPPSLVAFAMNVTDAGGIISPEFKRAGSPVVLLPVPRDAHELPDFAVMDKNFRKITALIQAGLVRAACTVRYGGLAAAISRMCFGNRLGLRFTQPVDPPGLFAHNYGSIILEMPETADLPETFGPMAYQLLGFTREEASIQVNGIEITLEEALAAWEEPLEGVFPTRRATYPVAPPRPIIHDRRNKTRPAVRVTRPRVFIPVFPGTNGEYDAAEAFARAGAIVDSLVLRNLSPHDLQESFREMEKRISAAQILLLPGGFSAGGEPGGAGKFITAIFHNPRISTAVMDLLKSRDGLILGIGDGFQALIRLGLVPCGEIVAPTEYRPALTHNKIGRHVSTLVRIRIVSALSPWFSNVKVGDIHTVAVSCGEGRFVAGEDIITGLVANGQVATQYVDLDGNPSNATAYNPGASAAAIEGITSPDGRVLGRMGHVERLDAGLAVNVPGNKEQYLFAAGVSYFS